MDIWDTMREIREATLAARLRTGNDTISTSVAKGRFNLVEVTYPKGARSVVRTLKAKLTKDELVDALNALRSSSENSFR